MSWEREQQIREDLCANDNPTCPKCGATGWHERGGALRFDSDEASGDIYCEECGTSQADWGRW
jgi:hypothetical protein